MFEGRHDGNANLGDGDTSKTQQEELQAEANDAGQSAVGAAGQVAP